MRGANFHLRRDRVADFDSLRVVYEVEGRLVNEAPLRVGVGRGEEPGSPSDLPIIRISWSGGRDVPYIPGSSLKGVLRSHVERLAAAIYGPDAVHPPFDTNKAEEEFEKDMICAVCGIFGSIKVASHLVVRDSLPLNSPTIMLKPGIGINRDFGGVQPDIGPFSEEYVSPGVEWSFNMKIMNIPIEDEGAEDPRPRLLRLLISSMGRGELQLGGRKSVGAGVISLKYLKVWKKMVADGELRVVEVKI